jgi:hypothetical protein
MIALRLVWACPQRVWAYDYWRDWVYDWGV